MFIEIKILVYFLILQKVDAKCGDRIKHRHILTTNSFEEKFQIRSYYLSIHKYLNSLFGLSNNNPNSSSRKWEIEQANVQQLPGKYNYY